MTTDQRARPSGGGDGQKAPASSSLIIQLPTTSANPRTSNNNDNQSDRNQTAAHNCREPTRSLLTSQIAAHYQQQRHLEYHRPRHLGQAAQQQRHQRVDHHRYQQNVERTSISHHLLPAGADSTASSASTSLVPASAGASHATDEDEGQLPSGTPPPNYHEIPGVVPSYHGRTSGPPPAYDDVVNPNAPPPSYQSLFGQVREARKTSNGLVDLLRQLFLVLIGTLGCTMIIGFLLLIPITMIFIGVFYINECRAENIPSFLVIGGFVWIMKNILNCYNQFKKDSSTINRPPVPRRPPIAATSRPSPATAAVPPSALAAAAAEAGTSLSGTLAPGTATATTTISTTTTTTTTTTTATSQANTTTIQQAASRHVRHPPMIGLTSYKCESILNYFLLVWFLAGCIVVYRIYEPDYENPLSASYCNRTVYLYAFWLMTSAFIIMAIILSCLCCLMFSSLMSCSYGR